MKKDLSAGVKKIAHFLGKDVTDEVAETIADRCSFSSMKVKAVAAPKKESGASGPIMYRKGIAGGWKKTFTVAQSERFDSFFNEKFANIDINIEYE
ncbi:sulfotransferase 1B1-like [Saccoglossus kowalevskii]|uniref:Sulfotransferase family cytosolic 1B member 1-like n=1 Tax=Saccoglossus kowalevskii TaxID=10224 RepID=A0ABM0GWZ2_SACKO|nr:PREDICTED: sulfotransferase family cytosolic 1B member 1-like [Saccoglossus kowalevskii]